MEVVLSADDTQEKQNVAEVREMCPKTGYAAELMIEPKNER